jgi:hypothetical protein
MKLTEGSAAFFPRPVVFFNLSRDGGVVGGAADAGGVGRFAPPLGFAAGLAALFFAG